MSYVRRTVDVLCAATSGLVRSTLGVLLKVASAIVAAWRVTERRVRTLVVGQWPALLSLIAGLALCLSVWSVLQADNRSAALVDADLDRQSMGVFADGLTLANLSYVLKPEYSGTLASAPNLDWSLEVDPGKTSKGRFSLVALGGTEYWRFDVTSPLRVIFVLPADTRVLDERQLRVGSGARDSCASWYDGEAVRFAPMQQEQSELGTVVVTCDVPAVGEVESLFFELSFEWEDEALAAAGVGRTASGLRISSDAVLPSDIKAPRAGSPRGFLVPAETRVQLQLAEGERLREAFPPPDGGRLGERSWHVTQGKDIEFEIERRADRAWVDPGVNLMLLLGGTLLGLVPALVRRRSPEGCTGRLRSFGSGAP